MFSGRNLRNEKLPLFVVVLSFFLDCLLFSSPLDPFSCIRKKSHGRSRCNLYNVHGLKESIAKCVQTCIEKKKTDIQTLLFTQQKTTTKTA